MSVRSSCRWQKINWCQNLRADGALESLNVSILGRFAGLDMTQLHVVFLGSVGQLASDELWATVKADLLRIPAPLRQYPNAVYDAKTVLSGDG